MLERRVTRQRAAAAVAAVQIESQMEEVEEPKPKPARKSSKTKPKPTASASAEVPKSGRAGPSTLKSKEPAKASSRRASQTSTSETPKRHKKCAAAVDLERSIAAVKKGLIKSKEISLDEIKQLNKDFTKTVDTAKREAQIQEARDSIKKPPKSTRSGLKRGALKRIEEYTQGKIVLMGMEHAKNKNPFDEADMNHFKTRVPRVKEVKDLRYEELQYLVSFVFLPELQSIQKGETKSEFHDRYSALEGKSKNELYSEMRLTLFTNEQRDFLNGYLQGVFNANKKDESGDINHTLINYVELVMLYETTLRIVKYVHKFETFEETLAFMKKKSREAYGIDDEDD